MFISLRAERTLMVFFPPHAGHGINIASNATSSTTYIKLEIYSVIAIRNLIITPNMVVQGCIDYDLSLSRWILFISIPYKTIIIIYFLQILTLKLVKL